MDYRNGLSVGKLREWAGDVQQELPSGASECSQLPQAHLQDIAGFGEFSADSSFAYKWECSGDAKSKQHEENYEKS